LRIPTRQERNRGRAWEKVEVEGGVEGGRGCGKGGEGKRMKCRGIEGGGEGERGEGRRVWERGRRRLNIEGKEEVGSGRRQR
jgi:hypothetical protein